MQKQFQALPEDSPAKQEIRQREAQIVESKKFEERASKEFYKGFDTCLSIIMFALGLLILIFEKQGLPLWLWLSSTLMLGALWVFLRERL